MPTVYNGLGRIELSPRRKADCRTTAMEYLTPRIFKPFLAGSSFTVVSGDAVIVTTVR